MEQAAGPTAHGSSEAQRQLPGPVRSDTFDVVLTAGPGTQLPLPAHLRTVDHALHTYPETDAFTNPGSARASVGLAPGRPTRLALRDDDGGRSPAGRSTLRRAPLDQRGIRAWRAGRLQPAGPHSLAIHRVHGPVRSTSQGRHRRSFFRPRRAAQAER